MFAVMFSILFISRAKFVVCLYYVVIVGIVVMLILLAACIFARNEKILAALSNKPFHQNETPTTDPS